LHLVLVEADVKPSLPVYADDERLRQFSISRQRLRRRIGQLYLHALLEQRGRYHEDDQQYQHHVDVRHDVDL
jgi:hypothetical protein